MIEENVDWKIEIAKIIEQAKNIQCGYARRWILNLKEYDGVSIFGAGEHGIFWLGMLKKYGIKVNCFIDNDKTKWGNEVVKGVTCVSPDVYRMKSNNRAVVIAVRNYNDILRQIESWGINYYTVATVNKVSFMVNYEYVGDNAKLDKMYRKIMKVFEICIDDESKKICYQTLRKWLLDENYRITYNGDAYFYTEKMALQNDEFLVDAGAFDGDTIRSFMKTTGSQFGKIYAFEMDEKNFESLKNVYGKDGTESDPRIELYQIGLSNEKGVAHYNSNYKVSKFEEDGMQVCKIDCIDNILAGKKVTFIKMDIEGSEMKALRGGERLIKMQKPRLAICIYHSVNDFLDIPVYIKKLNPAYKIIIRHHSYDDSETICYAYE